MCVGCVMNASLVTQDILFSSASRDTSGRSFIGFVISACFADKLVFCIELNSGSKTPKYIFDKHFVCPVPLRLIAEVLMSCRKFESLDIDSNEDGTLGQMCVTLYNVGG